MHDSLLTYLNSHEGNNFVFINEFLKKDEQYKGKSLEEIRDYSFNLVKKGLIEVKDNNHTSIGLEIQIDKNYENTLANLENWHLYARITKIGRLQIMSEGKMWYDTENARRQFEDYPATKKRAEYGFFISIASLIVAILIGVLKIGCNS